MSLRFQDTVVQCNNEPQYYSLNSENIKESIGGMEHNWKAVKSVFLYNFSCPKFLFSYIYMQVHHSPLHSSYFSPTKPWYFVCLTGKCQKKRKEIATLKLPSKMFRFPFIMTEDKRLKFRFFFFSKVLSATWHGSICYRENEKYGPIKLACST